MGGRAAEGLVDRVRGRRGCRLSVAVLAASALAGPGAAGAAPSSTAAPAGFLAPMAARWTGDLDGMVQRRIVRVLVTHSKTFYFLDRGRQRGATYDTLTAFETDLNRRLGRGQLKVRVVFIPVSREDLLPALREGRGDLAVANLTVTPERRRLVDFSQPLLTGVSEIAVTGPATSPLTAIEDLAGREVFVRRSSSYHESLVRASQELVRAGRRPIGIRLAPESLEDEDLLEMVNAGLVKLVVVDSHKAEFWAQIFPRLRLHPQVAVRTGGEIAWAFRPGSPRLRTAVNRFAAAHREGTAFGNEVFRRYLLSTRYVRGALEPGELERYERTVELFRKYGDRFQFDYLLLAAQGYQESQLDQRRRSPAGAVGVMQVMPATGREMGVGNVRELEPNIHAGAKYLRLVADEFFPDARISPLNRTLFAFASYNAGPTRVVRWRREAARAGLNPDLWFDHVERIAARRVGREPVQYVSNIHKYYVAYHLLEEEREERARALAALRAAL